MITITVGQALLILLDKKENINKQIIKKIYLTGPCDTKEEKTLERLLKDPLLSEYNISKSPKIINNDPTRRYFETHLAFNVMQNEVSKMDLNHLKKIYDIFLFRLNYKDRYYIKKIFEKVQICDADENIYEFTEAIYSVYHHPHYNTLSNHDKLKLAYLIPIGMTGVWAVNSLKLPLAEAFENEFTETKRGRIKKNGSNHVRTFNFGLLKGHMPVSQDDLAFRGTSLNYVKPSERYNFLPEAKWPNESFKKLVHPFSSSISGTLLALIRFIAHLEASSVIFDTTQQLATFMNCLISILVYNSGGHSFNEFFQVLELDDIQKAFSYFDGFKEIKLAAFMTDDNQKGLDLALDKTIKYNNQILIKCKLHEELTKGIKLEKAFSHNYFEKKSRTQSIAFTKTSSDSSLQSTHNSTSNPNCLLK